MRMLSIARRYSRSFPASISTTMFCRQTHTARFPRLPALEMNHSHQRGGHNLNDCSLHHQKGGARHGIVSTIRLAEEKPIVRSPRPQNFNQELLSIRKSRAVRNPDTFCRSKDVNGNDAEYQRALQRRWVSTTREATEEWALPTPRFQVPQTTLEMHADPVRYRAKKTSPEPCVWQCYAREWDMMQLRCRMGPATKAGFNLPKIPRNTSIVQCEIQTSPDKISKPACDCSNAEQVNCYGEFTRPMSGYGGFIPRNAVEPKPISDEDCITSRMCSTSRRTYRGFPPEEYGEQTFAHKGPLSKTVTLTYPFNPFNKIE